MKEKVAVVGLGYVGLPLALLASKNGYDVWGVDLDESKIDLINSGKSPFVDEYVESMLSNKIKATTDISNISDSDIVLVCVPTPVKNGIEPDLEPLKGAVRALAPHLKKGALLVIESTINPGVCEDVVIPLMEECGKSKSSYMIAHCPERINPGDPKWNVGNINRVVGADSKEALGVAVRFYESIVDGTIKPMGSIKEAEAVKVVENSFRDINIAFVNELAMSFQRMDINIENVIDGAATKPFAFMPHRPGVGVGGHCIPVDPYYLIEYARGYGFEHDFLRLARRINSSMPEYTVELLIDSLNKAELPVKGTKIALLGLSYKANVDDDRESPSYEVKKLLLDLGASLNVYDPFIARNSNCLNLEEALQGVSAVLIATHHDLFKKIKTSQFKNVKVVIDGRNIYKDRRQEFEKANIIYRGVGIN